MLRLSPRLACASKVGLVGLALLGLEALSSGQVIVEAYPVPLTSYLPSGTTTVQGLRPHFLGRSTNMDGSQRASPGLPMQIVANPFENAWRGQQTQASVRVDVGSYAPNDIDLAIPSTGLPWIFGRSYSSAQQSSGGSAQDSNGPVGKNWAISSQPELQLYSGATTDLDVLYLVLGADRYIDLKRQALSSNQFKAKNGAAGCFQFAAGSSNPDTYTYTDQVGNQFVFFGFNSAAAPAKGQLWKMIDTSGSVSYVGDPSTASTAISSGFDASGRITTAFDGSDRRYSLAYSTLNSVVRLTQVKCEVKDSGTWGGSPVNVRTAVQVDYDYYGTGDSHGDVGNLKKVTTTTRLNDSGTETDEQVKKRFYRYWQGSYNSSTNPGYPNYVKYALDSEGVRRADWDDNGALDDSFVGLSDAALAPYATTYLEYDSSHRVSLTQNNGQCGCGSGSMDGTFTYTYDANGAFSNTSNYDVGWKTRTVIGQPDGSYVTQYFDEVGQPLSRVVTDSDPAGSPTKTWVTGVVRDSNGFVSEIDTPASVSAYVHNSVSPAAPDGSITVTGSGGSSPDPGLIWTFERTASGTLTGFVTAKKYQLGSGAGSVYLDGSWTYDISLSKTLTDVTVVRPLLASRTVYSEAITSGASGAYTTSVAYTDYNGSSQPLAVKSITVTEPSVASGNNGSGSSNTSSRHFLTDGKVDFENIEDGVISYHAYTAGQETTQTQDADTTSLSPPLGFSSSGGELVKTTTTTLSNIGFRKTVAPPNNRTETIYESKLADQRLVRLQFEDYASSTYYGPVTITVLNQAGKPELTGVVALPGNSTGSGQDSFIDETKSDPIQAVSTGSMAQMTTYIYDTTGTQLQEERKYFLIPGSGAGSAGTNYDSTFYGYDAMGRRWRTKDASGTIRRTTFDVLGRSIDSYIGTNDHSFSGGEVAGSDNMVKTENTVYDGGSGGGNSLLTQRTLYVENSTTNQQVTSYLYDYRGRRILDTPAVAPYVVHKFDNMGREIATGSYSSSSGLSASTDPTSTATNRLSLTETYFDEMGRVWKSVRHNIDASDGSDDDTLLTLNWYDERGRQVKVDGSELRKTRYDRLGRVTDEFVLAKDNDSSYSDVVYSHVTDVAGDIVLEQRETRYDASVGTVLLQATISRFQSDYNTGETTGALDTNADGGTPDALKLTSGDIKGRVQITAKWYDSFERVIDQVVYGTNGGSTFDRNGLSAPARSDTELRSTWTYNTDGTVDTITDPRALVTKSFYDSAGRVTKQVRNYDAGVNGGDPDGTDQNVTVAYGFTNGLRTSLTAVMHSSGDNQVTTYIFGTTAGTPGQMKISSNNLLRAVKYPDSTNTGTTSANIDSDSSDVVSFAYDAQGREVYKKDQAGNGFETDYDGVGRATQKRVTTLASGFDGAVRRIATTFDALGRTSLVTQYDNATVGSGSVTDEVKYSYDGWGNLLTFAQDRNSAVSGGGDDYDVGYTWAKATTGRNTLRKSTETLPSGKTFTLNYKTRNGLHDDDESRVTEIVDGALTLSSYEYVGVGQVVKMTYPEASVTMKQYTGTGMSVTFPDLDSFNRVLKSRWTKALSTPVDFYHVELTYDRNSNITSADDQVHTGFDVKYAMDSTDRLTDADEGTLASGSITSRTRREQWTLSHTGNWDEDKLDLNGDGDWSDTDEVDDCRTHNKVNELTARNTNCSGGNEYSLAYDAAGNMTDDNKDSKYEWDAFYRLRKVKNQSNNLVAEYRYNGLGYRIAEHADTDTDGDVDSNDKWFFDAFDERWRQVSRFRESDTSPKEEFVHHQAGLGGHGGSSYIDLVVCRYKDANTAWTSASDGTLEERVYYCQNQHADVSALVSSAGGMLEWVKYSAYGVPFGLPGGDTDSDGDCDSADVTQIQTWISGSSYDVRGDPDINGVVDVADKGIAQSAPYQGVVAGRCVLSPVAQLRRGWAGAEMEADLLCCLRNRRLNTQLGRWLSRDSVPYVDSLNLQELVRSNPVVGVDPTGEAAATPFGSFVGGVAASPVTIKPGISVVFDAINDCVLHPTPVGPGPICDIYPEWYEYQGCDGACFCRCASSTPWNNYVRACLACLYSAHSTVRITASQAHQACYLAASAFSGGEPDWLELTLCAARCYGR